MRAKNWTTCRVFRLAGEHRVPSGMPTGRPTTALRHRPSDARSSVRHCDKVRPVPASPLSVLELTLHAEPSAGFKVQIDCGWRSRVARVPWPSRSTSRSRRQPVGRWPSGIEPCQDRGGDGVVTRPSR